jgi:hypothetical protein
LRIIRNIFREKNIIILVLLSINNKANISNIIKEIIISYINLTYTRKSNSNSKKVNKYSFILILSNILFCFFNIISNNYIIIISYIRPFF